MNNKTNNEIEEIVGKVCYEIGLIYPLEIEGLNDFVDKIVPIIRQALLSHAKAVEERVLRRQKMIINVSEEMLNAQLQKARSSERQRLKEEIKKKKPKRNDQMGFRLGYNQALYDILKLL